MTAFSLYLRTGRRADPAQVELKYNPWHDAANGGGSGGATPQGVRPSGQDLRQTRPNDAGVPDRRRQRADHPDNYSTYIVQPGDSLARIAMRRKGLKAGDLAWLNQQAVDKPLQIGQRIKVPHQRYLDEGRAAKNRFVALGYYMETHGGTLPPAPANPPSLEGQILDRNWKRETKNGYNFHIDAIARSRRILGEPSLGPTASRSRRNQTLAGKPDRRASDDGGHFIAVRFNGPSDSFNHFAQDASFNRGAYRAMENNWAENMRVGRKVVVDIVPLYEGTSKRPYRIIATWYIDGKKFVSRFPSEAKGKADGKR